MSDDLIDRVVRGEKAVVAWLSRELLGRPSGMRHRHFWCKPVARLNGRSRLSLLTAAGLVRHELGSLTLHTREFREARAAGDRVFDRLDQASDPARPVAGGGVALSTAAVAALHRLLEDTAQWAMDEGWVDANDLRPRLEAIGRWADRHTPVDED